MTIPFQMLIAPAVSLLSSMVASNEKSTHMRETQRTLQTQYRTETVSNAGVCLQDIVASYLQYQAIVEEEKGKRRDIAAWEASTLKTIESQREIFLRYLDRSFDEREKNFEHLFKALDKAIASENNESLALILTEIRDLAKSSPFKELQNLSNVQAALTDPEHEWKF